MKTQTSKILAAYHRALKLASRPYQKQLENRAKELCAILRAEIGPFQLMQGMGSWSLSGDGQIPVVYSDESKGTIDVFDFACRHADPDQSRKCCEVPQVSAKVIKALQELGELCETVNDPENRLSPFDLNVS